MDNVLETPSRVLRRIRDHDARNDDLPSLPSLSFADDLGNSVSQSFHQNSNKNRKPTADLSAKGFSDSEDASQESVLDADIRTPTARAWSTPVQPAAGAGPGGQQKRVTPGSSGSRVRFARSTHTRSFDQGGGGRLGDSHISYVDVEESVRGGSESSRFTEDGGVESTPLPAAAIQRRQKTPRFQRVASLSTSLGDNDDEEDVSHERSHRSADSIPDVYLPPSDDEQEGLGGFDEGISQSQTRSIVQSEPEQKSYADYNTSLKTSTCAQSPFDPIRHSNNVSRRRQDSRQTQYAPSVSDSPSDPETSVSTPDVASIPLPRPTPFKSRVVDISVESERTSPSQATPRPAPRRDSPSISLSTPTSLAEPPSRGPSRSPPNRTSPAVSKSPASSNAIRNTITSTSPQPQPTPAQPPKNHFSTPAAKRAYQMVMSTARPGASMKKGTASYPFRRPRFSLQHMGPAASESSQAVGEGTPGVNDSFLSTASSHDLTIRTRANASFDMISDSMGRLDKIKLQVQLSRMNKLLTSENTELFEKNRNFSEENERLRSQVDELQDLVYALKHGMELHEAKLDKLELEENGDAERLHEELEISEKKLAETKRDRRQLEIQLSQAQADADEERQGRLKLQEEVDRVSREQKDAERIVEDMRLKQIAQEAQLKHLKSTVKTRDEEIEALQVAGAAGSNAADLSSSLRRAKAISDRHAEDLERELEEVKDALEAQRRANARLEDDVKRFQGGSSSEKAHAQALQKDLSVLQARFTSNVEELKLIEETLGATTGELTRKQESLKDALEQISNLEAEIEAAEDLGQQLAFTTDALRASEVVALDERKRAEHLEDESATIRAKVAALERQLEDAESRLSDATRRVRGEPSVHEDHISLARHDDAVATLEAQLDEAYRENGRLKQRIIENDTPGKRMTQDLMESKCKLLEEQKAEMAEQIAALRRILTEHVSVWEASLSMAVAAETTTPRRASLGNRTATPGQKSILKGTPNLKDATWGQTDVDEQSIRAILAPLQSESAKLIQELRAANDRLDEKFEELDQISAKNVSLKQERDDALERERTLRTDLDAFRQRHRRLLQRLQAVRCLMCGENQNVSGILKLETKAPTDCGNESADFRDLMADVEFQAERLQGRKAKLESEKRVLEAQAQQNGIQLKQAQKRAIAVETVDPRADDGLKRALDEEHRLTRKLQQERDAALASVKTNDKELLRMGDFIQTLKAENAQLKSVNQGPGGRPRSSSKNAGIRLEGLGRGEANNRDLQRNATPIGEPEVERLRYELVQSQKTVGVLRKEHAGLISKLNALNDMAPLQTHAPLTQGSSTPAVEERIQHISDDIRSLGYDADALADELMCLRSDRDRLQSICEEAQATMETNDAQHRREIHDLRHQLEELQREENLFGELDKISLRGMQRQHKDQCKGLFLQIRYLQVCMARETDKRSDLAYQKRYLLNIVACFEQSESEVLALISRVGYPVRGPQVRTSRLKRVVFAVMFTIRVRRFSERWQKETSMRPQVLAALEDVRRRRTLPTTEN